MTADNKWLSEREAKIIKSNVAAGLLNGVTFGFCWGSIYGPISLYSPSLSMPLYKKAIFKYMGTSIVKTAPMIMIVRVANDYCEGKQLGAMKQAAVTFGIAMLYLTMIRFP